jgi:hypothetical protein
MSQLACRHFCHNQQRQWPGSGLWQLQQQLQQGQLVVGGSVSNLLQQHCGQHDLRMAEVLVQVGQW